MSFSNFLFVPVHNKQTSKAGQIQEMNNTVTTSSHSSCCCQTQCQTWLTRLSALKTDRDQKLDTEMTHPQHTFSLFNRHQRCWQAAVDGSRQRTVNKCRLLSFCIHPWSIYHCMESLQRPLFSLFACPPGDSEREGLLFRAGTTKTKSCACFSSHSSPAIVWVLGQQSDPQC